MKITVVGQDPSLRHWGLSRGSYDLVTGVLLINSIQVIEPYIPTGKQVRQNSKDLESAKQLCEQAIAFSKGADAVFVEVPVGSQSARAMASYGVCVGIIGSLRAIGIPLFEVSPNEVKVSACGKPTASKGEMITWATEKHPEAHWPVYAQKGKMLISSAKAEHQADSIAAIYAGIASNPFQQLLPLLKQRQ
jgi:hypothetical protein